MEQVFDIILLCVSLVACLYCFILHKRLKAFSDMKNGVGASVAALNQAVADTERGMKSTTDSASALSGELNAKIDAAKEILNSLNEVEQKIVKTTDIAVIETEKALEEFVTTLHEEVDKVSNQFLQLKESQHITDEIDQTEGRVSIQSSQEPDEINETSELAKPAEEQDYWEIDDDLSNRGAA